MPSEFDPTRGELIGQGGSRRVYFRTVDVLDSVTVRRWAEKMCRGETLDSLAGEIGVTPQIDSLVTEIAKGLPADAREEIRQVFSERLSRRR